MATGWVERWRDVIAAKPELPGVWRRRDGGFRVRGRATDPRTGKLREINWALPQFSRPREAFAWLQTELDKVRAGATTNTGAVGRTRVNAGYSAWSSAPNIPLSRLMVPTRGSSFRQRRVTRRSASEP